MKSTNWWLKKIKQDGLESLDCKGELAAKILRRQENRLSTEVHFGLSEEQVEGPDVVICPECSRSS